MSNGSNSSGVKPTDVIFSKLILVRGEVNHNYNDNSQNVIRGPVEVRAATVDAFKIVNYYFTCIDEWTGDFTGTENAYLMIGGGARKGFTFKATGSWQNYLGTLTVRKAATPDSPYDTTYRPQTSSSFPGTLSLEEATVLSPLNATDVFTVKSLSLAGGSKIVVAASPSACSQIVVTDAFTQTGTVALDTSAVTVGSEGVSIVLLTVPASQDLSEKDFKLDDTMAGKNGYLSVKEEDGSRKLLLVVNKTVTQTVTDSSASVPHQQSGVASSMLDKTHWSDGELPHAYADYLVAPNPGAVHLFTPEVAACDFAGASLSFKPWCYFYLACNRLTVPKLAFLGNNCKAFMTIAVTGGTVIDGGIVEINAGTTKFGSWADLLLQIDSEITGSGDIVLESVDSTSSFQGASYFTAANTNFTGTISVSMYSGYTPTEAKCQTLFVNDGRNLGGALSAMNYKALTLTRYGRLSTTNAAEIVLAGDANRGVYVDGVGQVRVGAWAGADSLLVLRRPLTLNGELLKDGSGKLVLDSVVKFGADSTDAPVANANRLTVKAGAIQVDGAAAVDGVTLTLDEGTQLLLKVDPSNATRMAQGIYNVKTTTPFVLGANVAKLPLALDLSAVPPTELESGFTCAVLTVAESAADDVEALLPSRLSGPDGAPKGVITRAPGTEPGTVTFSATFERRGLMLIFR